MINDERITRLAEQGKIPHRDAGLLLTLIPLKEIYAATQESRVWELRDKALIELRNILNERYPIAKETCS